MNESIKVLNIKKSADFKRLSQSKNKFFAKNLLILCNNTEEKYLFDNSKGLNADNFCRVGFTVSKKISKLATKRNKAKRRLREAFKILSQKYCQENSDYSIIARPKIIDSDFSNIKRDMEFCLKNLKSKR